MIQIFFSFIFLFTTVLFQSNQWAKADQIDPEAFEWMSESSVNIMKTYKNYNEFLEKYDPIFLLDLDTAQSTRNEYTTSTTLDTITVGPFHGEAIISLNFSISDFSIEGFLLLTALI